MQDKKKSLAEIMYEQEQKDIERAIATLEAVRIKKENIMLQKLHALSTEGKLYMPKCDFCGEETEIVQTECTQPDAYDIVCTKCARYQEYNYKHMSQIYQVNRKMMDEHNGKQTKCIRCNGELELSFAKNSNGGQFGLVCKNCGKHIH